MLQKHFKDYLKEKLRSTGQFVKIYDDLCKHDEYDIDKLRDIQYEMLINMLTYSYENIEYYKNIFDKQGLKVSSITKLEDLSLIPILTKDIVRKEYNKICIHNKFKLHKTAYTSGTSGKPLKLIRDNYSIYYENANFYRLLKWANYKKGDRLAIIRGDKFKKSFYYFNFLNDRLYVSSFDLSYNLEKIYNLLKQYDISFIHCYPSSIEIISKYILNHNKEPLKMKAIITSSETVTNMLREDVSKAFQCKIFDYYGQAERVSAIMNCDKGEYHILTDYGAEYLKHLDGNKYEIISTNLFNFAMPLVNYATGDIVEVDVAKTLCTRGYPIIKKILGRKSEFINIKGNKIYSAALTHVFYELKDNNIIQSQFVQDENENVTLNVILQNEENTKTITSLYENLEKYIGKNHIKIVKVEKLISKSNGKTPFIINRSKEVL